MSMEKMREEFEAAYIEEMARLMGEGMRKCAAANTRFLLPNGDYEDTALRLALWAWQASRAALVIELPDAHPDCNPNYREGIEDCTAAIEAAGVKVKL